jgi:hypothetical protein
MLTRLFTLFLLLISANAFSQSKKSGYKYYTDFTNSKPSIEISYGVSDIRLSNYPYELSDAGMFEMKLGFTSQRKTNYGKNILRYENGFLSVSNASSKNYPSSENAGIKSDMWRFGLGHKGGYAVSMGSFTLQPYNSNSFLWTRYDYENKLNDTIDYSVLNDFNEAFRFGSSTEAGLNLQFGKYISIHPKYEIADVYPRHLFGKQLMSSLIEFGGIVLLEGFTRQIMKSSPVAGAFVDFILKNAYEYGFYQLRKDQMYWPFTSAAPLRYSTFKVGATFTF